MATSSGLEVRPAAGPGERAAAMALRRRVFCEEQGVALELDVDGRDEEALHVVAFERGELVGTCRLVLDGTTAKLGRMAVERRARGRGIGAALLRGAEEQARASGARRIGLHAQAHARDLYARGGFVERGAPFEEAGIPHVHMEKRLA